MSAGILTVSQINFYIKTLIEGEPALKTVFVSGEISGFTRHYKSGHLYFSLKDERSVLKTVMFSSSASRLRFEPRDGMKVIIRGRISLYEPSGQYQLYAEDMQPDGVGALALAYEQLRGRLEKEGLFKSEHKKPLPAFPFKVGVITSGTGAARRDIENILSRRWPSAEIVLYPVAVQGQGAAQQLTKAVEYVDSHCSADVIIIGRGGGSAEDLWAFNDEALARAIYNCKTPVISAVGHETDFTICDFVADMRAPTPSAAAELAVPDQDEIYGRLSQNRYNLDRLIESKLKSEYERLELIKSGVLFSPEQYIESRSLAADSCVKRFRSAAENYVLKKENEIKTAAAALNHLSPLSTLSRGYALPSKDGKVIFSSSQVNIGDKINLRLNEGSLNCTVEDIDE